MNKRLTFVLAFMLIAASTWAQVVFCSNEQFKAHRHFLNEVVGIDFKIPKGFYIVNTHAGSSYFKPDSVACDPRFLAGGLALTENQDCLLAFPFERLYSWPQMFRRNERCLMNTARLFSSQAGTAAKEQIITDGKLCGGADSIVISEVKHKKDNGYGHDTQVTILMNKNGYFPMYFRLFFNEEGLKHKEQTVRSVLKAARYTKNKGFKINENGYWSEAKFRKEHRYSRYFADNLSVDD